MQRRLHCFTVWSKLLKLSLQPSCGSEETEREVFFLSSRQFNLPNYSFSDAFSHHIKARAREWKKGVGRHKWIENLFFHLIVKSTAFAEILLPKCGTIHDNGKVFIRGKQTEITQKRDIDEVYARSIYQQRFKSVDIGELERGYSALELLCLPINTSNWSISSAVNIESGINMSVPEHSHKTLLQIHLNIILLRLFNRRRGGGLCQVNLGHNKLRCTSVNPVESKRNVALLAPQTHNRISNIFSPLLP